MQFQADILGVPVIRSASVDVSALGAAWLAGLAVGVWRDTNELAQLPRADLAVRAGDERRPARASLRRLARRRQPRR